MPRSRPTSQPARPATPIRPDGPAGRRNAARRRATAMLGGLGVLGSLFAVAGISGPAAALPSGAATLAAVSHPAVALTEFHEFRMHRAIAQSRERTSIATADTAKSQAAIERAAQADAVQADALDRAAEVKRAARAKARKAVAAKKAAAALAAAQADPQAVAKRVLTEYGFGSDQFGCLVQLWTGESNWNYRATNSSSGAYGIPQALPAAKMASAGADWATNPETQIRWGLDYIQAAYGTPCGALGFWQSHYPHWY